jgi:ubiquinone biosynthesis protein
MSDALWAIAVAAILATATSRVSGVRLGLRRAIAAGGAGVVTFGLVGAALDTESMGLASVALMAISGLLAAMATAAGAELLARPRPRGSHTPTAPVLALRARVARLRRYAEVTAIVARNGLPTRRHEDRTARQLGPALVNTLQQAGGVFVKLGQLLSTRPDLVSPDVAAHLRRLQQDVTRIPYTEVEKVIVEDLGASPAELFTEFNHEPVAAASIAQVHQATLVDGRLVAVKVQRPGIAEQVRRDLDILARLAVRLERSGAGWARDMRLVDTVRGLTGAVSEELDFGIEARNGEELRDAIARHPRIRVPVVHRGLSSRRVLVTDWVEGRSVGTLTTEDLPADEGRQLATDVLRCMLDQLLVIGTFHADPHPGNVVLTSDGALAMLDFGSVGRLNRHQTAALLSMLIAVDRQDPAGLRDALDEVTIASAPVDGVLLERALGQVLAQPLGAGGVDAAMFVAVMAIMRDFRLAVDPVVAGALRAVVTLDGTLRSLAKEFDVVEASRHHARELVVTAQAAPSDVQDHLRSVLPLLAQIPRHMDRLARQLEQGELTVGTRMFPTEDDRRFARSLITEFNLTLIGTAAAVAGMLLLAGPPDGTSLSQHLGIGSLFVGLVFILRVVTRGLRHSD